MLGTSVTSRLKAFDVYRKLPQDMTEPTMSGAIVSIASTILMILLFISELNTFLTVKVSSEMFIDEARGGDKLRVNIDIVLPRLPCEIVSIDAQDIMGTHSVNLEGKLHKHHLDKAGKVQKTVEIENKGKPAAADAHSDHGHNHDAAPLDAALLKSAFEKEEGCQIIGYMMINKVPGNFHISSHAFFPALAPILKEMGKNNIDLSHIINHLSFGSATDLKEIKSNFREKGILNPLDKVEKIKPEKLKDKGVMHQYYINVVPTTYQKLDQTQFYVHQFTANSNDIEVNMLAALYFRYDISPITVKFTQRKEGFLHFLVQICAIIGGIFTVAGIIDAIIHKSVVTLLKKAQEGKLS